MAVMGPGKVAVIERDPSEASPRRASAPSASADCPSFTTRMTMELPSFVMVHGPLPASVNVVSAKVQEYT